MFDFVGKAKYKAWKELDGMSKEDAMAKYVALLKEMLGKADDEQSKKYLAELDGEYVGSTCLVPVEPFRAWRAGLTVQLLGNEGTCSYSLHDVCI